jgi:hypothetical protein
MLWVRNFKSLQSAVDKPGSGAPLEVHTWLRSETGLISPLVDWLMSLVARSGCVPGKEEFVELALREAMSNAILHGNRLDSRKLVHVRCCVRKPGSRTRARHPLNEIGYGRSFL